MFEDKDDDQSIKELERLEKLYTLGNVNFDSVIIIDFGNNLKSVLTSLVYTDVNQDKVLFTTINQWFDESIFYENTIKNLYYPSVDYKEFKKYNSKYFKKFNIYPTEITILAYDALGLIYYAWKKNGKINSVNDMIKAGQILISSGARNVLIKGGHLKSKKMNDILINKKIIKVFNSKKYNSKNTHGTGCTLSSSIATYLSCGKDLIKSCELGIKYVNEAIKSKLNLGKGNGPINHLNSITINKKFN